MKQVQSILAFDYGGKRTGVAVGSTITGTSSPLTTLIATQYDQIGQAFAEIDKLIKEWQPDLLVVGMPYNKDGSVSEMSERAEKFAELLRQRYDLPVDMIDERLTSAEAGAILKDQRRQGLRNKKVKKEDIDSLAASLIADSWLRAND